MVVLVTLGGCHLLDGLVVVSIEARKEDCAVLRRRDCEGYCAHPREPQRATLVELVIELPSLGPWGSCGAQHVGLVWCQLATEPPSELSTQWGLACWQAREPRDKNHRVILVFPLVCILVAQACITSFTLCLCSCSCN